MRHVVLPVLLIALSGCGNPLEFDPATTAILKVTGIEDDAQKEQIQEKAKELVLERAAYWKSSTSKHGEMYMIKASPVKDVQAFADRITFGEVTSVEGNIIHLRVGNAPAEDEQEPGDDQDEADSAEE